MEKERRGRTRDLKVGKEGHMVRREVRENKIAEKGEGANLLDKMLAILRRKGRAGRRSHDDFLGQSRAQCHSLQVRHGEGGLAEEGLGMGTEFGLGANGGEG